MNATAPDLIALPARINAAGCKAVRDNLTFPEGYSSEDRTKITDYVADHASAENHALIRDLLNTSFPAEVVTTVINRYWFRKDYNDLLHNTLLIINHLHRNGHPTNVDITSSATASITYPGKATEPHLITTHEELNQAAAIVCFITAVNTADPNVKNRQIEFGSYYAITSPYLETYVRENHARTGQIIAIVKGRRIRTTKKGLTPVLLALHNEHIKTLTAEAPDLTDKMFDYYYERNTGTNDITPLLEYLGTANALTSGYL